MTWERKDESFLGVSGWAGVESCGFGRGGREGGMEGGREGARVYVCVTSAGRRDM